jgi:F-type H+-transporting ATPase subunit b
MNAKAEIRSSARFWWAVLGLVGLALLTMGLIPSPALAAEGSSPDYWKLSWRIINFLILAVLIFKLAKAPAKTFFSSKRREAQEELEKLESAKAEAEEELAQLKAKLDKAGQEIEGLMEQLRQTTARNREKVIAEASSMAEAMVAQAKVAAETELKRARAELVEESTRMIISKTEEMLKKVMTSQDHRTLLDEALGRMEVVRGSLNA